MTVMATFNQVSGLMWSGFSKLGGIDPEMAAGNRGMPRFPAACRPTVLSGHRLRQQLDDVAVVLAGRPSHAQLAGAVARGVGFGV